MILDKRVIGWLRIAQLVGIVAIAGVGIARLVMATRISRLDFWVIIVVGDGRSAEQRAIELISWMWALARLPNRCSSWHTKLAQRMSKRYEDSATYGDI